MFLEKNKRISSGSLSHKAWSKFKKQPTGMAALIFILIAIFIAIFAYYVIPDKTPDANQQILELATQKPGFRVKVLKIRKNENSVSVSLLHWLLYGKRSNYKIVPVDSVFFEKGNLIAKIYDPDEENIYKKFSIADILYPVKGKEKISGTHIYATLITGKVIKLNLLQAEREILNNNVKTRTYLLGTDQFGRDLLSRLILGTRVSISVGFISVAISLLVGIILGSIAGFYGGKVDELISWFINVVWSVPTLLLVIAITFALGKGFWQIFLAVGLTMWVEVARIVRGQMLSAKNMDYVEAGRSLGFSNFRLIFKHILPNILSPVIVISAANFAAAILIEAGLSFLGIGVQPPMPSWGTMIKEYYSYIVLHAAYLAIIPGIAIILMVMAFMTLGNSLRDALDVKTETGILQG